MTNADDILALAAAKGWDENFPSWKRQGVLAQVSTVIDGWLATVTTLTSGDITWGITPDTATGNPERGKATSVDEAMEAARTAVTNRIGVLF